MHNSPEFKRHQRQMLAIVRARTPRERTEPKCVDASRRARIARGSGTAPDAVARLILSYEQFVERLRGLGEGPAGAPS